MKLSVTTVSAMARQYRREAFKKIKQMESDYEKSLEVQQEAKVIHAHLKSLPQDFLDSQMQGDIERYTVDGVARILQEQRFIAPEYKSCEEIEDEITIAAAKVGSISDIAINPFKK